MLFIKVNTLMRFSASSLYRQTITNWAPLGSLQVSSFLAVLKLPKPVERKGFYYYLFLNILRKYKCYSSLYKFLVTNIEEHKT